MNLTTNVSEQARQFASRLLQSLQSRRCIPRATYRLEFNKNYFTFRDAIQIIPYLSELGVSHIYSSPILKVSSDASHGYATVDYSRLNSDLGNDEDYHQFIETLHSHEIGLILDIVPNHMSTSAGENPWWTDVLEHGQSSRYSDYFEIDWHSSEPTLHNRILLPILGEPFGDVLEQQKLSLTFRNGKFFIEYFNHKLPVDPSTYSDILDLVYREHSSDPNQSDAMLELESVIHAVLHLPPRTTEDVSEAQSRQRESTVIQNRLRSLFEEDETLSESLRQVIKEINGTVGESSSFNKLESLLNRQGYRLSRWKAASDEINYRRFFDVNELAAICTERLDVFYATHSFLFELLMKGDIQGLRVDHVDGLYDPQEYLWRLQWFYLLELGKRLWKEESHEESWSDVESDILIETHRQCGGPNPLLLLGLEENEHEPGSTLNEFNPRKKPLPLYVIVEKILGPDEPIPADWPVAGTTGYDFLNLCNGLFIDPCGYEKLTRAYQRFASRRESFLEIVADSKQVILDVAMSSELHLVARRLKRLAEKNRHSCDFTFNSLMRALAELIICFPVYRTYVGNDNASPRDKSMILKAIRAARRRNPAMDEDLFDFIRNLLLDRPDQNGIHEGERNLFVGRFQQVTSPVMAKGVEDTAFYRYFPLLSANEVGSHPPTAPVTLSEFHDENQARSRRFSSAMLCSSTHDTKRSEDVRSRMNSLSEIPDIWRATQARWSRMNRHFRSDLQGESGPSRNDESLFYQTLVGVWPSGQPSETMILDLQDRLMQFMMKAIHEAKERTSWVSPNQDYEDAVARFIKGTLRPDPSNQFLAEVSRMVGQVERGAIINAGSGIVLKMMCPGVPDIYQGQEIWDDSLVDPDNRRAVDYRLRRSLLENIKLVNKEGGTALHRFLNEISENPADPRFKLFVHWKCLDLRTRYAELFERGHYQPLSLSGAKADHFCAFTRSLHDENGTKTLIVVVPRFSQQIARHLPFSRSDEEIQSEWRSTVLSVREISGSSLRDYFTGELIPLAEEEVSVKRLLRRFPLAVLVTDI